MFPRLHGRSDRRRRIIDGLLELDPGVREQQMLEALAEGIVGVEEVDAALRLLDRLDALRAMRLPERNLDVPQAALETVVALDVAATPATATVDMVAIPIEPDPEDATSADLAVRAQAQADAIAAFAGPELVAILVGPEEESAVTPVAPARASRKPAIRSVQTIGAVDTEARLMVQQHRSRRAHAGPRTRTALNSLPPVAVAPARSGTSSQESADEAWPTIAWLRPGQ
jgi:hypothetical protein